MDGVDLLGMTTAVVPKFPSALSECVTRITDQINFAPTAVGKKTVLRSWECQPSTPFLMRHKSRKIWKRFRRSMEAIRARVGAPAATSRIEEHELEREISKSANAPYVRAVKRLRVLHMPTERGSSFLETKWELETGRRKRKLVVSSADGHSATTGRVDESEADGVESTQSLREDPHVAGLGVATDQSEDSTSGEDDEQSDQEVAISDFLKSTIESHGDQTGGEAQELAVAQEHNLVRSALRMNSLDGEDAALLNEFLSRAQAKRAANAAMVSVDKCNVLRQDKVERQVLSSPAIQSRKVLEELDVNSPKIQKSSTSNPAKSERLEERPEALEELTKDNKHSTSSPTIACRRSTRTRSSPPENQGRSLRPVVPNQIPVRRANGTEFVFLQRTEAQELALNTRKNTRRNKGNAILPKNLLQAIANQERNDETTQPVARSDDTESSRGSAKDHDVKSRRVRWKEDNLVQFAPERTLHGLESPSPEQKTGVSSRREGSKLSSATASTAIATALPTHSLPATPSKKVRRINTTAAHNGITDDSLAHKPMPAGTPIPKRKKLTPRLKDASKPIALPAGEISVKHPSSKERLRNATATESKVTSSKRIVSAGQQGLPKISGIPRSRMLVKPAPPAVASSTEAIQTMKRVRAKRALV